MGIRQRLYGRRRASRPRRNRSEEHTSELQSRRDLVCRLLLEKKNETGDLVAHTAVGDLRQPRPVVYQETEGARRAVDADYVVDADGRVRFRLGSYDPSRPLVIDPVFFNDTSTAEIYTLSLHDALPI